VYIWSICIEYIYTKKDGNSIFNNNKIIEADDKRYEILADLSEICEKGETDDEDEKPSPPLQQVRSPSVQLPKTRFPMASAFSNLRSDPSKVRQIGGLAHSTIPAQLPALATPVHENKPKRKIIYPDYIIVCDDLGDSMRNKALTQLLKTNRHYRTMVILSSQDLNDLLPAARKQLDYVLVFGRQSQAKMKDLYDNLKLDIDFQDFLELYSDATSKQYSFFYINRAGKEDEFRKGFTEKYLMG
jgi:hypothetical protein